ncbi:MULTISPECIES: UvrD-helicase domain-containing protein [Corynebacterium]|uniref:UvrD-helicase domain-containing protein n=1 Tax=Corynebacterium TaxID=1716 RepID=UPI00124E2024|nr:MULTISPECIES: UvrD-helicase domain-containing protein [Corynebacterium]
MIHNFVHACAGAGKTELIVQRCANTVDQKRRLVITLTDSGQEELVSRLSAACSQSQMPDVMGWYAFMIRHYVRPYLPILFPDVRPTGFIFERDQHPKNFFRLGGIRRYFSSNGSIYKETLPELAVKVAEAMQGAVERRLGRIYDEIIIDEVQDISRKSLDVIERLLSQAIPHLILVGDVRQSLLDSDQTSSKNRSADRLGLIYWYRKHESAGLLSIKELRETWRSNQRIADFSDRIFPTELGFASTNSKNQKVTGHDGVFLVHEKHLVSYLEKYHPVPLRYNKSFGTHLTGLDFTNIRKVKGFTYERVIIFPTNPMLKLIASGTPLRETSACVFYVGVTRARASVAIIVDDKTLTKRLRENPFIPISVWAPGSSEQLSL